MRCRAALLLVLALACATGIAGARAALPSRFDSGRAWSFLRWQVAFGPRPAGSPASRKLAARIVKLLPGARYQKVPGGLRNVLYTVRGRNGSQVVVLGAHYDTKDIAGFVGANDGASGVAVLLQLARTLRPFTARATVVFAFFDGEEEPAGRPGDQFERYGLRGSTVAARAFKNANAMILLDMVGDRDLSIPRESSSDLGLYDKVRDAARKVGHASVFPGTTTGGILDDHTPFQRRDVRALDVIDFTYPCWHQPCDDLAHVSPRSLDAVGETMARFLTLL